MKLLMICLAACAFGGARAQEIHSRAFWAIGPMATDYDEPLLAQARMDVFFQIRNAGTAAVTVLCPKKSLIFEATPSLSIVELVYRIRLPSGVAGVGKVIPSTHEVVPISLKPGETTEVRLSGELPRGVIPENVALRYSVEERIGQQFSAWFGDIVTPIRKQPIDGRGESIPWSAKEPNKAPEPTPGSVTPRAIEGKSK